ncbi:MAG: hypothetical protein ACM3H8_08900 [Sphingobacteriales bacterium]
MKSNFSTPGFLWPLLTLICIIVIVYGLNKVIRKTGLAKSKKQITATVITALIAAWITLLTVLSYKGFFADFGKLPPRLVLALIIPLPFMLWFAFSKTGTQLLLLVPPHWLIAIQSFRIFVEILLWFAFLAGKLPVQMSFEGGNFDILTGVLALPAAYLIAKRKTYSSKIILAFNVIGILLLFNILIIAVLSMPTPFRYFMNEPSNTLVTQFPFILLPGVLVPIAYSFHIFSLRQLFTKKRYKSNYH